MVGQTIAAQVVDANELNLLNAPLLSTRVMVKGKTTKRAFIKARTGRFGYCKAASGATALGPLCLKPQDCDSGQFSACEGAAIQLPLTLSVTVDGVPMSSVINCFSSGVGSYKCVQK